MNKNEFISIKFDLVNGLIQWYTRKYHIKLSELRDYAYDSNEVDKLIMEKGDYVIYEVYEIERPVVEGEMIFGVTRIFPGVIGQEYNFTRGHYHVNKMAGEIYVGIKGCGLMLLQDLQGNFFTEVLERGSLIYIPGKYAHRVVNTCDEDLVFLFAYPAIAGHDYELIKKCGFKKVVLNIEGKPTIIDNPKYNKCKQS
ncbi:glucose-6-phosphate isomerase family protein [Ignisphaera sp. 4213-co]|uniref:glucose-6-phosphate isomerase n=1 Tax=Ignisphaera cupida TaxID=3050454 RepID=A0ABD4Z8L9_9CREN|nr:glucose-6-phosphate isomerase family protein [Ignisphaera sp. 4213-co]MDK6029059.1 glucose-6-phosphate isomerase family protein [Ignisphaera sp. 4213-co]